ncbi:MAG TPA: hypothetical protein VMT53_12050 [Terriglobales bacterium]|nr:hypothetical protein [Terriglobales bacterium]
MRVLGLLGGFLLAASLLSYASDQVTTPASPQANTRSNDTAVATSHWHSRQRRFLPDRGQSSRDENVCLMLRTYIVVRESRDSDVTRRDGEVICQPAWKFQTRSAVARPEDR